MPIHGNIAGRLKLKPEPRIAFLNFVLVAALAGASSLPGITHGRAFNGFTAHRVRQSEFCCTSADQRPQHNSGARHAEGRGKRPEDAAPRPATRPRPSDGRSLSLGTSDNQSSGRPENPPQLIPNPRARQS